VRWDLPLPGAARAYAERLIPDARPTLVINPCSSHALRNWRPTRYAALAQHAAGRLQMRVILAGGPSELERRTGAEIEQACGSALVNQIGKDTLPEMLALLSRASVLVSPDSGPVHMATMVAPGGGAVRRHQSGAQWPVPVRPMVRRRVPPGRARLSRLRARRIAVEPQDRRDGRHGPHQRRAGHRETRRVARITP